MLEVVWNNIPEPPVNFPLAPSWTLTGALGSEPWNLKMRPVKQQILPSCLTRPMQEIPWNYQFLYVPIIICLWLQDSFREHSINHSHPPAALLPHQPLSPPLHRLCGFRGTCANLASRASLEFGGKLGISGWHGVRSCKVLLWLMLWNPLKNIRNMKVNWDDHSQHMEK